MTETQTRRRRSRQVTASPSPVSAKSKTRPSQRSGRAAIKAAEPQCEPVPAGVTKHDRVLTLLSRRDGATISEMMQATGWQQHSVRGFLAGTVKKKLGFTLASSKADGELRRYHLARKSGG